MGHLFGGYEFLSPQFLFNCFEFSSFPFSTFYFAVSNLVHDKGNFVILILNHDKAKGNGSNKPVSFAHQFDNCLKSTVPPQS